MRPPLDLAADFATIPYVVVTTAGGRQEVRGMPSCSLGHQISGPAHRQPDGVFARWSWDGSRLRVWNDRYGLYPLYYAMKPGWIGVSPSIPALLAHGASTALDDAALAVFLRVGFFIGDRTPFRHIKAVPPDVSFDWADGRLSVTGTAALGRLQSLTRSEALDGYITLFRSALARRPPRAGFVLPLSGGRDSRHILLELHAAGHRPSFCVTTWRFPPRPGGDVQVAAAIAAALQLPHVALEQTRSRFRAELEKNAKTGFCTDEHAWVLALAEYLDGRATTIYDGIGGGVLSAGAFLDRDRVRLFEAGRFPDLAESLRTMTESPLKRLLTRDAFRRFNRDLFVAEMTAELERHAAAPNPVSSFYFWNRTRREIALAPHALLNGSGTVFCPYVDHDVYDLLASLPADMFLDHEFHTQAIHRAHPGFRAIPFEDKTAPPAGVRGHFLRFLLELLWHFGVPPRSTLVNGSNVVRGTLSWLAWGRRPLWSPILALYLLQLERAAEEDAGATSRRRTS